MHVYMRLCICVYVHLCIGAHAFGGQRITLGVTPQEVSSLTHETGPLTLAQILPVGQTGWPGSPRGFSCPCTIGLLTIHYWAWQFTDSAISLARDSIILWNSYLGKQIEQLSSVFLVNTPSISLLITTTLLKFPHHLCLLVSADESASQQWRL